MTAAMQADTWQWVFTTIHPKIAYAKRRDPLKPSGGGKCKRVGGGETSSPILRALPIAVAQPPGLIEGTLQKQRRPPVVAVGDVCWHTLCRCRSLSGRSKPFKRVTAHLPAGWTTKRSMNLGPRRGGGRPVLQDDIVPCTPRWLRDAPSLDPSHPPVLDLLEASKLNDSPSCEAQCNGTAQLRIWPVVRQACCPMCPNSGAASTTKRADDDQ